MSQNKSWMEKDDLFGLNPPSPPQWSPENSPSGTSPVMKPTPGDHEVEKEPNSRLFSPRPSPPPRQPKLGVEDGMSEKDMSDDEHVEGNRVRGEPAEATDESLEGLERFGGMGGGKKEESGGIGRTPRVEELSMAVHEATREIERLLATNNSLTTQCERYATRALTEKRKREALEAEMRNGGVRNGPEALELAREAENARARAREAEERSQRAEAELLRVQSTLGSRVGELESALASEKSARGEEKSKWAKRKNVLEEDNRKLNAERSSLRLRVKQAEERADRLEQELNGLREENTTGLAKLAHLSQGTDVWRERAKRAIVLEGELAVALEAKNEADKKLEETEGKFKRLLLAYRQLKARGGPDGTESGSEDQGGNRRVVVVPKSLVSHGRVPKKLLPPSSHPFFRGSSASSASLPVSSSQPAQPPVPPPATKSTSSRPHPSKPSKKSTSSSSSPTPSITERSMALRHERDLALVQAFRAQLGRAARALHRAGLPGEASAILEPPSIQGRRKDRLIAALAGCEPGASEARVRADVRAAQLAHQWAGTQTEPAELVDAAAQSLREAVADTSRLRADRDRWQARAQDLTLHASYLLQDTLQALASKPTRPVTPFSLPSPQPKPTNPFLSPASFASPPAKVPPSEASKHPLPLSPESRRGSATSSSASSSRGLDVFDFLS